MESVEFVSYVQGILATPVCHFHSKNGEDPFKLSVPRRLFWKEIRGLDEGVRRLV